MFHMNLYELSYLISPEVSQEQIESLRQEIRALIEEKGGILDSGLSAGQKHLAYPIKKRSLAHLEVVKFYTEGSQVQDLEQKIKSKEHIIRSMCTQKKVRKAKPASVPKLAPGEKMTETAAQKPKEQRVELEKIEEKLEELFGDN